MYQAIDVKLNVNHTFKRSIVIKRQILKEQYDVTMNVLLIKNTAITRFNRAQATEEETPGLALVVPCSKSAQHAHWLSQLKSNTVNQRS